MTPPRIDKIRVLRGENNNACIFTEGTDILSLHLEYPVVNVIQHAPRGHIIKLAAFGCVSSDAEAGSYDCNRPNLQL
jgi:hypothetical protein